MEDKTKKTYEAPALTAVSFKTEMGFATSLTLAPALDESTQEMEDYSTANSWSSGSNNFWN